MDNIQKEIDKIIENFDLLMYYDKEKLDNEIVYNNGLEHGKKEGIREIAKNMLLKNFDVSYISEITGLTLEEINSLKENKEL